jgi:hypothetical protein
MMFAIFAFVLFVIATILCIVGDVTTRHILAFGFAGLACLALAGPAVGAFIAERRAG